MAKRLFPNQLLALVSLLTPFLATAAPPHSQPSLINPFISPPNISVEPRIYCDRRETRRLQPLAIRECKSAVAHLAYAYPEIRNYGPNERRPYRTPIISTHETRCEVKVELVEGFSSVRSSWREIKEAAWDVVATCIDARKKVGRARTGEEYGIEVSIRYHFPPE
ncbi:MAG: hypothetical protein LQ343_006181 [Gyalolechia ehrenbergii]|nr:MAG: hypothetical protein LQ343_006181 [Gyalolechia ehrenbergii]